MDRVQQPVFSSSKRQLNNLLIKVMVWFPFLFLGLLWFWIKTGQLSNKTLICCETAQCCWATRLSCFGLKPFCLMRYKNPRHDVQSTHVHCLYKYLSISLGVGLTLESKESKTRKDVEMYVPFLSSRLVDSLSVNVIHNLEMLCMNLPLALCVPASTISGKRLHLSLYWSLCSWRCRHTKKNHKRFWIIV